MNIIGVVVNKNMEIIGFEMEGTEKEFGGMSAERRTAPIRIDELRARMFKNRQVEFKTDGTFEEKNGFHVKESKMLQYDEEKNTIVPINNELTLTGRVEIDGVIKGYDCTVAGNPFRLATDNIVRLSKMLKTTNFDVRYYPNGKAFLAGKPGIKLADLPVTTFGSGKSTVKQKEEAKAVTNESGIKGVVPTRNSKAFSVVELFDLLHQINAKVIDLPTEDYKRSKLETKKIDSSFISFGAGGIGQPKIDYTAKSLNVNGKFNYVGTVQVKLNAGPAVLYPYIIKSKHLFFNGENHIKRFAIAISPDDKEKIEQTLGSALVLQPYNVPYVVQPLKAFLGNPGVLFYEIDTTNLDIVRGEVLQQSILAPEQIKAMTIDSVRLASLYAYFNKVNKSATEAMGGMKQAPLYGPYAGLGRDDLAIIEAAGINVYTGRFEKTVDTDAKTDADAEKIRDMASGKEHEPKEKSNFEVEYQVKDMATNLAYADIMALKEGQFTKKAIYEGIPTLAGELLKHIATIEAMTEVPQMQKYSDDMLKDIDKKKDAINRALWYHKMACFANGGYVKFADGQPWEATKNLKDGTIYRHTSCEGLMVKLTGGLEMA